MIICVSMYASLPGMLLTRDGHRSHSKAMTGQDTPLSPARDAGTLIVVRPRAGDGLPELLMTRRADTLRFAGGAMVFPGGAIDAGDRALAEELGGAVASVDMAARIAAIRETIEECGLALTGMGQALARGPAEALRQALHRGEGLGPLIRAGGLRFNFEGLVPFARWCPRAWETRIRYDTRFYLATVEGGHDDLVPDGSETASLLWSSARDMLARADAGEARIIFPTRCNLERLAQFDTVDALIGHARMQPVDLISPWLEMRDGEEHICIPEESGYPVTARPASLALRG